MRETAEIGRISMTLECDGKPCAVVLSQDKMRLLVNLAASLSDTGSLPVRALGAEYHFETIDHSDNKVAAESKDECKSENVCSCANQHSSALPKSATTRLCGCPK